MALPNPGMDFVPFDVLTAEELDDIVENIESLADGTGFDTGAIPTAAYADDSVTAPKIVGIDKSNLTTDSNPYKFSAYRNAAHNSANTPTKIPFDSELFDTNGNFASGTYTVPVSGFYQLNGYAGNTAASSSPTYAYIYKNGVFQKRGSGAESSAIGTYSHVSGLIQATAGDTFELYFIGGNGSTMGTGAAFCYFDGFLSSRT